MIDQFLEFDRGLYALVLRQKCFAPKVRRIHGPAECKGAEPVRGELITSSHFQLFTSPLPACRRSEADVVGHSITQQGKMSELEGRIGLHANSSVAS